MQDRYTVKSVKRNDGMWQVHLTKDSYQNTDSQPEEMLLNTRSPMYHEGDEWLAFMTRVAYKKILD